MRKSTLVRTFAQALGVLALATASLGMTECGGEAVAEVVTVQTAEGETKQISQVSYRPIELELERDADVPAALNEWIVATLGRQDARKSGAIIAANYDFKEMARLEFFDAMITEVTLAETDQSKQQGAQLRVVVQPEFSDVLYANPELVAAAERRRQKPFNPSNFRVPIGDLPCGKVSKIESIGIKQTPVTGGTGEWRDPALEPGKLEFPDLKVTFAAEDIAAWDQWFAEFVIQGNSGPDQELSGQIEYLDEDGSAPARPVPACRNFLAGPGVAGGARRDGRRGAGVRRRQRRARGIDVQRMLKTPTSPSAQVVLEISYAPAPVWPANELPRNATLGPISAPGHACQRAEA